MKLMLLLRGLLFGLGAVGLTTALAVDRVPLDHTGMRDDRAVGEGLRIRVPVLNTWSIRPIRGRVMFGPPSEERLLAVETGDGHQMGVALTIDWHAVGKGGKPPLSSDVRKALTEPLARHLGGLSLREAATPLTLEQRAVDARPKIDAALAPLRASTSNVLVHGLRLPPEVDTAVRQTLVGEMNTAVSQAEDVATAARSDATVAEGVAGTAVEAAQRSWDEKDAQIRRTLQTEIDSLRAQADAYTFARRTEGEAEEARLNAEGALAVAKVEALRDKLNAEALAGDAGRLYTAIRAARTFKMGDLDAPTRAKLTTMGAWRRFFLRQR